MHLDLYFSSVEVDEVSTPTEGDLRDGSRGPDYIAWSPRFSSGIKLGPHTSTHVGVVSFLLNVLG